MIREEQSMIKLYDENFSGYFEAEVKDFYYNDFPQFFARTDKDSYVRNFREPFYDIPEMRKGSQPTDDGNLILSPEEKDELVSKNPAAEKWIRPFVGAREFIQNKKRFCLWLVDCPPNELRKMKLVYERVEAVKKFRAASKKAATRKDAATPWLFQEIRQPKTNYLLVPRHSSELREYIPIGYMNENFICGDANLMIPGAKFFHFGVLTSSVHMTWTRMVCGRLKSDYRYSADVVYNNFVWPPFWRKVERTAAEILSARKKFPDASFADLYDPLTMPKELRRAHEANDRAVMEAYDFSPNMTESELQIELMRIYEATAALAKFFAEMK